MTKKIENNLYTNTQKQGVFCCFEVTIGWFGRERVDFLTYDTKGIWRCYEVKVSKSDFYSGARNTFVGHYNYYAMPRELFEQVREDIPEHVGVFVDGNFSVKRAKKQDLGEDEQVLKNSMIRSLSRESDKLRKSKDPDLINRLNRRISRLEKERNEYMHKNQKLRNYCYKKFGREWNKDF